MVIISVGGSTLRPRKMSIISPRARKVGWFRPQSSAWWALMILRTFPPAVSRRSSSSRRVLGIQITTECGIESNCSNASAFITWLWGTYTTINLDLVPLKLLSISVASIKLGILGQLLWLGSAVPTSIENMWCLRCLTLILGQIEVKLNL